MFTSQASRARKTRLEQLKQRLAQEHPELGGLVEQYAELDRIARRTGLFGAGQSHAWSIAWWPVVPVLGTFSSGKSTFINGLLGKAVQRTGNQAVDDHFTVLAYAGGGREQRLPGIALDADPRLPFYGVSERILELEGGRRGEASPVNSYLQMQTVANPLLKHLLLVDSPGFDADQSRATVLRLTDHIIELADLVLVFFDARHPEPGAMQETLEHLVSGVRERHDADKFLFVLNQIDVTAAEDNLDEVVAAWQRALVQHGMGGHRFFCLYSEEAARLPDDPAMHRRYTARRERDLSEITQRLELLGTERSYRLIAHLDELTRRMENEVVPVLQRARRRWTRGVITGDVLIYAALIAAVYFSGLLTPDLAAGGLRVAWFGVINAHSPAHVLGIAAGVLVVVVLGVHYGLRRWLADLMARRVPVEGEQGYRLRQAFLRSTRFWRGMAASPVAGWGKGMQRRLTTIRENCSILVRTLNDLHTRPGAGAADAPEPSLAAQPQENAGHADGKTAETPAVKPAVHE
ncbi:dynamin family protein [Acidihalobacter ferrooxydans]|uniref:Dynamin N-terminal domain-containing protein n=1 Tax=Acidihalobacter ferrooxydans TaxID=1765967 RepID=A0A1P8UH97_9GAMM|nr:dynamin family protein [Acidihalobacter ferrooxydans]APZ43190.1 hypothetical protein BW247_08880 [Acidihalobacter ferrooxydans]